MLFKMFHDAAIKYVFKKIGSVLCYLLIIGYFFNEIKKMYYRNITDRLKYIVGNTPVKPEKALGKMAAPCVESSSV